MQQELDKHALKSSSEGGGCDTILCPQYSLNEDLKIYMEENIPPASMYRPVGYNDLARVQRMMQGDDEERRTKCMKKS